MRSRFVSLSLARRIIPWVYDTKCTPSLFPSNLTLRHSLDDFQSSSTHEYNIRHRSISVDRRGQSGRDIPPSLEKKLCICVKFRLLADPSSIDWRSKEAIVCRKLSLTKYDRWPFERWRKKRSLKYRRCVLMAVVNREIFISSPRRNNNNIYIYSSTYYNIIFRMRENYYSLVTAKSR